MKIGKILVDFFLLCVECVVNSESGQVHSKVNLSPPFITNRSKSMPLLWLLPV